MLGAVAGPGRTLALSAARVSGRFRNPRRGPRTEKSVGTYPSWKKSRSTSFAALGRKIDQRRPAFEVLDENAADAAGAGNRAERGDRKAHEGTGRDDVEERRRG